MLTGVSLLVLGAVCGTILRVPAFIALNAVVLAIYGWVLRHEPAARIGTDLVIALLAIQGGYALTILGRALFGRMRQRVGDSSGDDRS
ncbi:MAG TPA: hypothetical protein VGG01_04120 [Xanthobacteraceae bacterium]|jgi:hypothetical protein